MNHEAIRIVHPNVQTIDDTEGCFDFDGNRVEIDIDAVNLKEAELQAEYDAQEYARNRSSEYPSWQEQMDMQYWDAKNGTNTWLEAIEAVKTKYPKGE